MSRLAADRTRACTEVERARKVVVETPQDHAARQRLHRAEEHLARVSGEREWLHLDLLSRHEELEQDSHAAESDKQRARDDGERDIRLRTVTEALTTCCTVHSLALDHLHAARDRVEAARSRLRAAEHAVPRDEEAIREAKEHLQQAKQAERHARAQEELRRHGTSFEHRVQAGSLAISHAEQIVHKREEALHAARAGHASPKDISSATRRLEKARAHLQDLQATHRELVVGSHPLLIEEKPNTS